MAEKVTDPKLLDKLNAGFNSPQGEKVTDPQLLARLNGTAEPAPEEGIDWEDVRKGGGAGLARGAIGVAGLPGDIGSVYAAGADKLGIPAWAQSAAKKVARHIPIAGAIASGPTSSTILEDVEDAAGPLYKPKTTAGRYAGKIGEFAPGALLPGGLAVRAANVVLPGVASETARLATEGEAAEPYAEAAGGLVGGMLANKTARALTNWARKKSLPTDAEIATVKQGLYDASDQSTIGNLTDPVDLKAFSTGLTQKLNRAGMRDAQESAPGAHGVVRGIEDPATGLQSDVYDLVQSRKAAKKLFAKGEGQAVDILLNELDQAIDALSPAGIHALKAADREHSVLKALETVNERLANVQHRTDSVNSGMNLGDKVRQNLTSFRANKKHTRSLKPDELAQIDRTIAGNWTENRLRNWSNKFGGGGGLGQALLSAGGGGTAYGLSGDPVTGIAVGAGLGGLGTAMRGLSNRMTMAQARKLDHMIRARSAAAPPGAGPLLERKFLERVAQGAPYGALSLQVGRLKDDDEYKVTDPPKKITKRLLDLGEQKLLGR